MKAAALHPAPLRCAALLLHALPPADRAWMLAELPNGQRACLVPLLDELESLGIPGDPGLIEDLDSQEEGIAAPVARWPQQLETSEVSVLCDVLAGEPVGVARFLLAMQSWSWAPQLLATVDADRRGLLQLAIPGTSPAACLEDALLATLKSHCEALPATGVLPERAGRWERLRARLAARRSRA